MNSGGKTSRAARRRRRSCRRGRPLRPRAPAPWRGRRAGRARSRGESAEAAADHRDVGPGDAGCRPATHRSEFPLPKGVYSVRVDGDPLQHPLGSRPSVHAGDDRGEGGRDEGAGGAGGRLAGELGERAAGPGLRAVAVGDGALGFWWRCGTCGRRRRRRAAGATRWRNVLDKLPKRCVRGRSGRCAKFMYAPTRADAAKAIGAFAASARCRPRRRFTTGPHPTAMNAAGRTAPPATRPEAPTGCGYGTCSSTAGGGEPRPTCPTRAAGSTRRDRAGRTARTRGSRRTA